MKKYEEILKEEILNNIEYYDKKKLFENVKEDFESKKIKAQVNETLNKKDKIVIVSLIIIISFFIALL